MSNELQQVQNNVAKFLLNNQKKIATALPKHLTSDRMLSIVMTEIRKNPDLAHCNQQSLISAIIQCSQLGLEPGSALGHAYLIPFKNRKQNTTDCQFIVGYRGMIDLARRSGQVISLSAQVVYEHDEFDFEYGLDEKLKHVPSQAQDKGRMIAAYAVAKLKDGGYQFEVMFKNDIDKIRETSKTKDFGPWVTNFEEMAKKTVIRRLFKYLPVSIELQKAVSLDESAERGEQDNSFVIDVEPEPAQPKSKAEDIAEKLSTNTATVEDTKPPHESDLCDDVLNGIKTSKTLDDLDLAMDVGRKLTGNYYKTVETAYLAKKQTLKE